MSSSGFRVVPRDQWPQPGDRPNCASCGKAPNIFKPYDHCQACGRLCCSSCLGQQLVLPGQPGTAPVAVCTHCAQQIRRAHQDAEMAVHRCKILEDMLNEQSLQTEKILGQAQELREENDRLLQDKQALDAKIKQLEVDLEVAAAKASLASVAAPAPAAEISASPVASPATASVAAAASSGSAADQQQAEAALEKKKKQLDMRELTLQEALKKVSNDAAKIVSQRHALQEEEKKLKSTLTDKFSTLFERERTQMERVCLSEIAKMAADFSRLVKDQKLSHSSKHTYQAQMDRVRKDYERKLEDLTKRAGRVEELERTLEEVQSANTSLLMEASQTSITPPLTEVENLREDLEHQLEEVKRTYEAECAKLRSTIEELQMAHRQQRTVADVAAREAAEQRSHQEKQLAQLKAELEAKEREAATAAEAVQQEREKLQATHEAELAQLRQDLYTREQVEEMKAALQASLTPAKEATPSPPSTPPPSPVPPAQPVITLADVQREKTAALKTAHQLWEMKHSQQLRQLKAQQEEVVQKMSTEYEMMLDALRQEVTEAQESLQEARRRAERAPSPVPVDPTAKSDTLSVASVATSHQSTEPPAAAAATKEDVSAKRQIATLKKSTQSLEKQLKEQSLLVLSQKRTIAALTAEIEDWKEKLSKQRQATRTTARRASVTAAVKHPAAAAAPAPWVAASGEWVRERLQLADAYTQHLTSLVDTFPALTAEIVTAAKAETQRQEEIRLRNAAALGRTTESIRGLQSELRQKAAHLKKREEDLEAKEAQLSEWEKTIHEKKMHIMNCCINLRKVTTQMKEQEGQTETMAEPIDC